MPDLSCVCDLHHSSRQRWILKPLSEARDQTHILMDTDRVLNALSQWELPDCVPLSDLPQGEKKICIWLSNASEHSLCFCFIFSFGATLQPMEFLGQGSELSHSHDLSCSCGNAGSFTHCARLEIKPATQFSQDTADPVAPQRELHFLCISGVLPTTSHTWHEQIPHRHP